MTTARADGESLIVQGPEPQSPDPLVGRVIASKYRLDERVGSGAMGMVFRATQILLDRTVAIKVLHPALTIDPSIQQRFQQEARAASRLNHPNSVQVLDFGVEPDGLSYIVMEFLSGRTLSSVIETESPMTVARMVDVISQTLSALATAHDAGVVHRDLKPDNIMLVARIGEDGESVETVKVADFGIARIVENRTGGLAPSTTRLTAHGLVAGTPEYMSPEQAQASDVDRRSDLYSCGVVLYEMATGTVPFEGISAISIALQHVTTPPPLPSTRYSGLDPRVEAIIMTALEKDRERRFPDARAMRTAVRALRHAANDEEFSSAEISALTSMPELVSASERAQSANAVTLTAPAVDPPTLVMASAQPQSAVPVAANTPPRRASVPVLLAVVAIGVVSIVAAVGSLRNRVPTAQHASPAFTTASAPPLEMPPTAPVPSPGAVNPADNPQPIENPPVAAANSGTAATAPIARAPIARGSQGARTIARPTAIETARTIATAPTATPEPASAIVPVAAPHVEAPAVIAPPAPAPVVAVAATPAPPTPPSLRSVLGSVESLAATNGVSRSALQGRGNAAASALAQCVYREAHAHALDLPASTEAVATIDVRDRRVDEVSVRGLAGWAAGCSSAVRSSFAGDLPAAENSDYTIRLTVTLAPGR